MIPIGPVQTEKMFLEDSVISIEFAFSGRDPIESWAQLRLYAVKFLILVTVLEMT
jgi:hypothetical protein